MIGFKMTDQEALQETIRYHKIINENCMTGIVNLDLTVVCEDGLSAKRANTETGSYIGRKIYPDISDGWRSEIVAKILDDCLNLRKTGKLLSLRFSRDPQYWLVVLTYMPLINQTTNNVIGYKVIGELPDYPLAYYKLEKLIAISHRAPKVDNGDDGFLSGVEHEIMFLLFHCNTYEQIANLLSLANDKIFTKSAIAKIINRRLYNKFGVVNLDALKEAAHAKSYHKKLPVSLFGEFMFPLSEL
jgi:hypothetical protein